jgi:hypothetical protein
MTPTSTKERLSWLGSSSCSLSLTRPLVYNQAIYLSKPIKMKLHYFPGLELVNMISGGSQFM